MTLLNAIVALFWASITFFLGVMAWGYTVLMPFMWPIGVVIWGLFGCFVLIGISGVKDWWKARQHR